LYSARACTVERASPIDVVMEIVGSNAVGCGSDAPALQTEDILRQESWPIFRRGAPPAFAADFREELTLQSRDRLRRSTQIFCQKESASTSVASDHQKLPASFARMRAALGLCAPCNDDSLISFLKASRTLNGPSPRTSLFRGAGCFRGLNRGDCYCGILFLGFVHQSHMVTVLSFVYY